MTVQWSCLNDLILFSKMLFFKTHSAKRVKLSVEMVWSTRLSSAFRIAFSSSLCVIFEYNPTTSMVQRRKSSGKSRSLLSFFKKTFVSFINDSSFWDNGLSDTLKYILIKGLANSDDNSSYIELFFCFL